MNHILLTFLISLLTIPSLQAQIGSLWVHSYGGPMYQAAQQVEMDMAGNIYISGQFYGETDFDPGMGSALLTPNSTNTEYFLKLDKDGEFVWVRQFDHSISNGQIAVQDIQATSNGMVILIYASDGIVDLDPDTASSFLLDASDHRPCALVALDSNGHFLWAQAPRSTSDLTFSSAIAVDGNDNIALVGKFQDSVYFDSVSSAVALHTTDHNPGFMAWYAPDGTALSAAQISQGSGNLRPEGITASSDGNWFVSGTFLGEMDFDAGSGISQDSVDYGVFTQKIDDQGNLQWAASWKDIQWHLGHAADDNGGVYFSGGLNGIEADLNPGSAVSNWTADGFDSFILHLNENGTLLDEFVLGGSGDGFISDICKDANGSLIVSGLYTDTVQLEAQSTNPANIVSNGEQDLLLFVLHPNLELNWVESHGGSGNDVGYTVDAHENGDFVLVGNASDTFDLFGTTFESAGNRDAYVVHITPTQIGIEEGWQTNELQVYPNPTSGFVHLSHPEALHSISVVDRFGRVVTQVNQPVSSLDLKHLEAGTYMIRVSTRSGEILTKRIVLIDAQ